MNDYNEKNLRGNRLNHSLIGGWPTKSGTVLVYRTPLKAIIEEWGWMHIHLSANGINISL